MKIKQFLQNIQDPKTQDELFFTSLRSNEHLSGAYKNRSVYLSDKIIGRPQRTRYHSVAELEKDGMVGVYKEMGLREWIAHRWLRLKIHIAGNSFTN